MDDGLDALARELRLRRPDRDLSALERLVWRRLDGRARQVWLGGVLSRRASLAATQLSMSAIALVGGVLAGMAVAGQAGPMLNELSVFSTEAPFGLSSLLSGS